MSTGLARMWSWVGERFNGTTDTGLGSRRGSQSVKPGQSVLVFLFLDLQKVFSTVEMVGSLGHCRHTAEQEREAGIYCQFLDLRSMLAVVRYMLSQWLSPISV